MQAILAYVERNWGVVPRCSHCHSSAPAVLCGKCAEHAYCGKECQTKHWKAAHARQCIGGGAGELGSLDRNVWGVLSRFLSADDLKAVRGTSRELAKNVRESYFQRFRWTILSESELEDPRLVQLAPFLKMVRVPHEKYLPRLQKLGARLTEISIDTNQDIDLNLIPGETRTLALFAMSTYRGQFPPNLQILAIGDLGSFNQPLGELPATLTALDLNFHFNQPLGKLPDGLETLSLGRDYNQPLSLPLGLKDLRLGDHFDHSLGKLPDSLEVLIIGADFDHPLGELPKSLMYLDVGHFFNRPLGALPASLGTLIVGQEFNQPLGRLPSKLKRLHLDLFFDQPIGYVDAKVEWTIPVMVVDTMLHEPGEEVRRYQPDYIDYLRRRAK